MNNTYALSYKGKRLENPLVKVLKVAKEKGIEYDKQLDLMPGEYFLSDFMHLVQKCGMKYHIQCEKYCQWREMLEEFKR